MVLLAEMVVRAFPRTMGTGHSLLSADKKLLSITTVVFLPE